MIFSFTLVIVFGLLASMVPVPYVAVGPGPTFNTLGKVDGNQVVTIGPAVRNRVAQLTADDSRVSGLSGVGARAGE